MTVPIAVGDSLTMSRFPIETLAPADYDALVALWTDAGLPFKPAGRDGRDAIAAQMRLPHCRFLGVRDDRGSLIASVLATHEGRKGWINRLAVRPGSRRTGVASELVKAAEDWLFAQGIPIVAALVEGYNTSSQALFSACGYDRDDTLVYFRKTKQPDV